MCAVAPCALWLHVRYGSMCAMAPCAMAPCTAIRAVFPIITIIPITTITIIAGVLFFSALLGPSCAGSLMRMLASRLLKIVLLILYKGSSISGLQWSIIARTNRK